MKTIQIHVDSMVQIEVPDDFDGDKWDALDIADTNGLDIEQQITDNAQYGHIDAVWAQGELD